MTSGEVNDAVAYGRERDELLSRIVVRLDDDPAILAAWLAGSLGRGNADSLSDLDLWIVVDDDRILEIAVDPVAFVHSIMPTIMEIHAPEIAPPGGAYLLTWIDGQNGPQQVDWYWQPASEAIRPGQTRLLFERRAIPVAASPQRLSPPDLERAVDQAMRDSLQMAFVATKYARRGNAWTTTGQMMHLAACIGTAEWLLRHGSAPDFDDRARLPLPESIPVTFEDRRAWIRQSLDRVIALLNDRQPSTLADMADAIRAVERWLEATAADED